MQLPEQMLITFRMALVGHTELTRRKHHSIILRNRNKLTIKTSIVKNFTIAQSGVVFLELPHKRLV